MVIVFKCMDFRCPGNLQKITQLIAYDCVKSKIDVFEILGAVCLVPGGWRKVMGVVDWFEEKFQERARFLVGFFFSC